MKTHRLTILLVALNLILVSCMAAMARSDSQQGVQPIVHARQIELVDDAGRVRASLKVSPDGEAVFRLMDAKETIRIKLGASEEGSGLVLLDGSTNPGLHALAKGGKTTLTLTNPGGRKRVLEP